MTSVKADQAHSSATLRSTRKGDYTVHELRAPNGVVIREFASSAGYVFGVAWRGPARPDLRQLLGSYFESFQQAAQSQNRHGVHGPLLIQQNGLVVELDGHMRSYTGRAYLANDLPDGVLAEDIR